MKVIQLNRVKCEGFYSDLPMILDGDEAWLRVRYVRDIHATLDVVDALICAHQDDLKLGVRTFPDGEAGFSFSVSPDASTEVWTMLLFTMIQTGLAELVYKAVDDQSVIYCLGYTTGEYDHIASGDEAEVLTATR